MLHQLTFYPNPISRSPMSLDIINARPFREQEERFHALVILRLMLFFFVRHDCELFLPSSFSFDTILQMIPSVHLSFLTLLRLTISCHAPRVCCFSLYPSLFNQRKFVNFFACIPEGGYSTKFYTGRVTVISRKVVGKKYTRYSRKVIWDMTHTLFLTL